MEKKTKMLNWILMVRRVDEDFEPLELITDPREVAIVHTAHDRNPATVEAVLGYYRDWVQKRQEQKACHAELLLCIGSEPQQKAARGVLDQVDSRARTDEALAAYLYAVSRLLFERFRSKPDQSHWHEQVRAKNAEVRIDVLTFDEGVLQ